jgi:hypothetical protein
MADTSEFSPSYSGVYGPQGGSIFEEGALETAKTTAKDPTQGLWKSGFEQLLAEDPSIQSAIESKSARDIAALEKIEADYDVMKPLSDLLKANKFQEAFQYASEKGVVDKLMSPDTLRGLRPAFTQEEMKAFFAAVPPDYAGSEFEFKPEAGFSASVDPFGTGQSMQMGYPAAGRAFQRKDDKTVENLAKIAAVAALTAGFAPGLLAGAGGAGAGAAGAGTAAGTSGGFLTGLKTAATNLLSIPETIGTKVAAAFGNSSIGSLGAKAIGNAVISGGITGAKGGDFEDILKSAAMAAGLTYVSDAAIRTVAKGLQSSGTLNAAAKAGEAIGSGVEVLGEGTVSNITQNVVNGLDQFTQTFTKGAGAATSAASTLASVAGAQAAAQPSQPPPQKPAPQELPAEEPQLASTITTTGQDFGAGLETGLYTGTRGASYQPEPTVKPPVEPELAATVTTSPEQLDFTDPFIQALINQYVPEATVEPFEAAPTVEGMQQLTQQTSAQPTADVVSPLAIAASVPTVEKPFEAAPVVEGLPQLTQTTTQQPLDIASPAAIATSVVDQPFEAAPVVEGLQQLTQQTTPEKIDITDPLVQAIMSQLPFEPAPIDPTTGMAEFVQTTSPESLDLADPLTQVLLNRYIDVKPPEPVIDDLEEFTIKTDKPINEGVIEYSPPIFTPVNPADIAKDYQPTKVKSKFEELLDKYGTIENLLKVAGAVGGLGGTKTPTTGPAEPVYDPRKSAGAGQWIDWEKVKAEADAAGMNLNTYTARNWNKIQNRALEAGIPQAVASTVPEGYNSPDSNTQNFDLLKYLEEYQPAPMSRGGMSMGNRVKGPGDGREDLIPALLSDGEYVIDAETMALLGNGSTDAGAKAMDSFRKEIRRHKGAQLAKGGISPNAKSPLQYLKGN